MGRLPHDRPLGRDGAEPTPPFWNVRPFCRPCASAAPKHCPRLPPASGQCGLVSAFGVGRIFQSPRSRGPSIAPGTSSPTRADFHPMFRSSDTNDALCGVSHKRFHPEHHRFPIHHVGRRGIGPRGFQARPALSTPPGTPSPSTRMTVHPVGAPITCAGDLIPWTRSTRPPSRLGVGAGAGACAGACMGPQASAPRLARNRSDRENRQPHTAIFSR